MTLDSRAHAKGTVETLWVDVSFRYGEGAWKCQCWVIENLGVTTYFFYPNRKHLILFIDPQAFWVVRLALASFCSCGTVFYCLEMKEGRKASKHMLIIAHLSFLERKRKHSDYGGKNGACRGWRDSSVAKSRYCYLKDHNLVLSTLAEWLRGICNPSLSGSVSLFWP